jgi:hypothetical protein
MPRPLHIPARAALHASHPATQRTCRRVAVTMKPPSLTPRGSSGALALAPAKLWLHSRLAQRAAAAGAPTTTCVSRRALPAALAALSNAACAPPAGCAADTPAPVGHQRLHLGTLWLGEAQ